MTVMMHGLYQLTQKGTGIQDVIKDMLTTEKETS